MIDPTFFDYKTKRAMRQNGIKENTYSLYQKDLIIKELTRLRHKKYGEVEVSRKLL